MVKSTYLKYGSAHLAVPEFMIGMGKDHKNHIYSSVTKSGNLAHHNGISAVVVDTLPKGNHVKAVKGEIVKYSKKVAKANTAVAKANTAKAELKTAEHDLKVAKTRGRKPLTEEAKYQRAQLKAQEKQTKLEEKNIKKYNKMMERDAILKAKALKVEKKSPTRKVGRPPKMKGD